MIFEGVKLMFVGMTTVMLFLGLMIFFINLVAKLTKSVALREVEAMKRERELLHNRKRVKEPPVDDADEDIAVIAAAVAAFEAERVARA